MENKKGFDSVKESDIIYVVEKDYNNSSIDSELWPDYICCDRYHIVEYVVLSVEHMTSENKYEYGYNKGSYDIMKTYNCNKYALTLEPREAHLLGRKTIVVDLTNSNTYQYGFSDCYVNYDDAKEAILKKYENAKTASEKMYMLCTKASEEIDLNINIAKEMKNTVKIVPKHDNEVYEIAVKTNSNKKVALFPGSFNPFTIGHKAIVDRALAIFDEVIILFSKNKSKLTTDSSDEFLLLINMESVKKAYKNNYRVIVDSYDGLTMDYARNHNATIIRGIRDVKDFEYEKNIAEANKKIGGVETMFFISDSELAYVSSSLVRELDSYNKDISNLTI